MAQFPNFFSGLAQGAQTGMALAERKDLMDLQKQELGLKVQAQEMETAALKDLMQFQQGATAAESAQIKDRQQLMKVLPGLERIASMPKDVRKGAVDGFIQGIEKTEGVKLSDVFVNTLKTANSENLVPMIKAAQVNALQNPEAGASQLLKMASNPAATAQTLTQLNGQSQVMQATGAPNVGPQAALNKAQFELKKLRAKQQGYLGVASKHPGTKASASALQFANTMNADIQRLEKFIQSGAEAGMREAGKISTQAQMGEQLGAIEEQKTFGREVGEARGQLATLPERQAVAAGLEAATTTAEQESKKAFQNRQPVPGAVASLVGVPQGTTVGQFKELGGTIPDQAQVNKLLQQRSATQALAKTGADVVTMVAGRPEILGVSGALARTSQSMLEQAVGLARLGGMEYDPNALVADTYKETFKDLGIDSAELQSTIINMAFSAAQASGETGGRISNQDVERFIREIGASTGSSSQFANTMISFLDRQDSKYRSQVETFTGRDPGASGILTMRPAELGQIDVARLSPQELKQYELRLGYLQRRSR